jgi:hypothetical protein
MWNRYRVVVTFIAALLLAPTAASAQSSIGGTVTDATGSVLPGVTVEARSPALIEQVRTVFTDGAGRYQIVELRPGTYSVTFTLTGFNTVVRGGIELTTGFAANVDVQLRVGAVEETVTVTGATPVVDLQNMTTRQVATRDVIDTVPVAKSFQSLGVLIPGIVTGGTSSGGPQDVGGQSGQSHMTLQIHGGRTGDQYVQIDGLSADSQHREDSSGPWIPDSNFQEYAFEYSANLAETETGGVRINQIPADGGNTFRGGAFFNFATEGLQANNLDDGLRAVGVRDVNRMKKLWQVEMKLGGPIVRDRLWFFVTHNRFANQNYALGTYLSQDPRANVYVPDLTRQAFAQQQAYTSSARLTWQATPRNKFTAYMTQGAQCHCIWQVGTGALPLLFIEPTPDASINMNYGSELYQVTWAAPVTSRLLLEAGASDSPLGVDWNTHPRYSAVDLPGILDLDGLRPYRNAAGYWAATKRHDGFYRTRSYRASVSYVTGSHAFKTGVMLSTGGLNIERDFPSAILREFGGEDRSTGQKVPPALPLSYITFRGTPVAATFYDAPIFYQSEMNNLGLYAQDQWRVNRFTVNAGIRFDHLENSYPDHNAPPTLYVPVARSFPGASVVSWKDLSPRLGVVYDLLGSGKTALKATANRYILREGSGYAQRINPMATNDRITRAWTDRNGNFFPDGDPVNPEANGELGPSSNRNFGNPRLNTFFDPDWAFGFGERPANWEFTASIQQELRQGVSATVGYFRRVYTNFEVQENRAVGPNDVDYFSVLAPRDPRLPGGGGQRIDGIPDLKPSVVGLIDNNTLRTDHFGKRVQHWDGIDVTINARMQRILLQGGFSVGKNTMDECDLARALPEMLFLARDQRVPTSYCRNTSVSSITGGSTLGGSTTPFQTQIKLLGSYTLPYDVQVAATLQSFPGPERRAELVYSNAEVQASLGRPLSATQTVRVNLIPPGTVFGDRINQLDLRFAKNLRLGGARLKAMLDLYNTLNTNAPLWYNFAFDANWERPAIIMPARMAKFGVQVDF